MKDLEAIRKEIDCLDDQVLALLSSRNDLVEEVIAYKKANNLPIFQPEREMEMLERFLAKGKALDLDPEFTQKLLKLITDFSRKKQELTF